MRNAYIICLFLIPGCGGMDSLIEAGMPTDAGPAVDSGPAVDAGPRSDAGPGTDGGTGSADAYVLPGTDGGPVAEDAWPGPTDAGTMASGLCGNGVLDPGEICDPGPPRADGTFDPTDLALCPVTDCMHCPVLPPGFTGSTTPVTYDTTPVTYDCVYYLNTALTPLLAARHHARLLTWSSAVNRDALFASLRSALFVGGSVTSSSCGGASCYGGLPLQRVGTMLPGTWYWVRPDGSTGAAAVALPRVVGSSGPGAFLALTATDAMLSTTSYPAMTGSAFVLVDPPPYAP